MESIPQKMYEQARTQYTILLAMILVTLLYFMVKIFLILNLAK